MCAVWWEGRGGWTGPDGGSRGGPGTAAMLDRSGAADCGRATSPAAASRGQAVATTGTARWWRPFGVTSGTGAAPDAGWSVSRICRNCRSVERRGRSEDAGRDRSAGAGLAAMVVGTGRLAFMCGEVLGWRRCVSVGGVLAPLRDKRSSAALVSVPVGAGVLPRPHRGAVSPTCRPRAPHPARVTVVELGEGRLVEAELQRRQRAGQLVEGAGTEDG